MSCVSDVIITCPHHEGLSVSLQKEVVLPRPGKYAQSVVFVAEQPGLSCPCEGVREDGRVREEGPQGDVIVGLEDQEGGLVLVLAPPVQRPQGEPVPGCAEDWPGVEMRDIIF